MYSKVIMQRFQQASNFGIIRNSQATGQSENLAGNIVKIYLDVEDGVVYKAKFKALGGVELIALCDILCDKIEHKKIEDLMTFTVFDLNDKSYMLKDESLLSLVVDALQDALEDYHKKQEKIRFQLEEFARLAEMAKQANKETK